MDSILDGLLNLRIQRPITRFVPILFNVQQYKRRQGEWPNLIRPSTLNEKILFRILFDRNPLLKIFSDKLAVRDYVKTKLETEKHLPRIYAVINDVQEIKKLDLPPRFVMKANHGSGWTLIVQDSQKIDWENLSQTAANWLQLNYGKDKGEWGYKDIVPQIFFEELLEINSRIPEDYKFFCYKGEPKFVQVSFDRFTSHKINFYDENFNRLPLTYNQHPNYLESFPPPANFDEMKHIARRLSAEIDFLRVDLYNLQGRVFFGELTSYPSGGWGVFEPDYWDFILGRYWE